MPQSHSAAPSSISTSPVLRRSSPSDVPSVGPVLECPVVEAVEFLTRALSSGAATATTLVRFQLQQSQRIGDEGKVASVERTQELESTHDSLPEPPRRTLPTPTPHKYTTPNDGSPRRNVTPPQPNGARAALSRLWDGKRPTSLGQETPRSSSTPRPNREESPVRHKTTMDHLVGKQKSLPNTEPWHSTVKVKRDAYGIIVESPRATWFKTRSLNNNKRQQSDDSFVMVRRDTAAMPECLSAVTSPHQHDGEDRRAMWRGTSPQRSTDRREQQHQVCVMNSNQSPLRDSNNAAAEYLTSHECDIVAAANHHHHHHHTLHPLVRSMVDLRRVAPAAEDKSVSPPRPVNFSELRRSSPTPHISILPPSQASPPPSKVPYAAPIMIQEHNGRAPLMSPVASAAANESHMETHPLTSNTYGSPRLSQVHPSFQVSAEPSPYERALHHPLLDS